VQATGADNVFTMGYNNFGQLGYGSTDGNAHSTPNLISSFGDVVAVAGGGQGSSFAVKSDGSLWGWGFNYYGNLGNNTTSDQNSPIQVVGPGGSGYLTNAKSVSTSSVHTLALKTDGTVWAFGSDTVGTLGDNRNVSTGSATPVQVLGSGGTGNLTNVVAVATGDNGYDSYALKSDGTVWAWGSNSSGQLGDGTTTDRWTPVQVVESGGSGYLTGIVAIAAGADISVALKDDGTVWIWGANGYGQLGQGNTSTESNTPVKVKDSAGSSYINNVSSIYAGGDHAFVITEDKSVWGWGNGTGGALGNGSTSNHNLPVEITNLKGIVKIGAGDSHTVAFNWD
jgi:alpha-tubulin suppressor-like RCC1 family protein